MNGFATVGPDRVPLPASGNGPPILLIHGAASDHRIWRPHIELMRDRFRCFAPTLRWFGPDRWRPDGPPSANALMLPI